MNMKIDAVIYIGNYKFPMGDAIAKRALGLGKAFSHAGYKVLFIDESDAVSRGDISEVKKYEEFEYCSIHHSANSVEHYFYWSDLKKIKNQIEVWSKQYSVAAIIFCGTKCAFLAKGIVDYAKRKKISIIADSMDWLTSQTGNFLFDALKQLDTTLEIKVVNQKTDGVICISEFLEKYYKTKKKRTLLIPPLSPYKRPEKIESQSKKVRLIYAGVPCRLGKKLVNPGTAKDRLDLAIQMLYEISNEGVDFEFIIYGLSKEQYDIVFSEQREVINDLVRKKKIFFYGKQSEAIVREAVKLADFTILLRERNRTSMAGFPTKIAESITLGTPVITTDTSDIKRYLEDGKSATFLNLYEWEEAKKKLRNLLLLDEKARRERKKSVLKNNSFVPEYYAELLKNFLR
ncbi:glycosyltransferase family 4 protein [Blautia glucerasea]